MNARTQELRAFEVFVEVPAGCVLHLQTDDRHAPHLRVGEYAVVDPADAEFTSGELYRIRWPSNGRYDVMQVMRTDWHGVDGVWFLPLNRPHSAAEADAWMRSSRMLYASDGPLRPEFLPRYLAGRVVGIFQAPAASDASHLAPPPLARTAGIETPGRCERPGALRPAAVATAPASFPPTGDDPMSRKSQLPTTPQALRELIAERGAFLTKLGLEHNAVKGEFFRRTSRRAAITKAERAAGLVLDQDRQAEEARHQEALEKTPVRTLADVAAVLDMLRREAAASKPTTRPDRLRVRLLTSASAVTKEVHDALALCWPPLPPTYTIPERAAKLMADERQRAMERTRTADPQKWEQQKRRALEAFREIPPETAERVVTGMELRAIMWHAHDAMVRLAHDDLDRQQIAEMLERMLEKVSTPHAERIAAGQPAVSAAIVTAYIDWQRAVRFSAAVQRAAEAAAEPETAAALKSFREAAERTAWSVQDGVLHTEAATLDDAMLQLCLVLEADDSVLDNVFSSGASLKLEELARAQPLPELPTWDESRGRPVTDEDWRTYLTAHPDRMHEATPAYLLRLFAIEDGAEVFALWSGYARAAAGIGGDLEAARVGIETYGALHAAMESREGFDSGDVLTEDERAHLATMGHLPAETVRRLKADAEAARNPTPAQPTDNPGLTPGEIKLVEKFRQMDDVGRNIMVAYSAVMVAVTEIGRDVTADDATPEARERAGTFATFLRGQIEELEALAKGGDDFADTVAAFEAEAPKPLCMPQAPTGRMVEAGAAAAGISPEQAQAIYTAMAEAYRQERAA